MHILGIAGFVAAAGLLGGVAPARAQVSGIAVEAPGPEGPLAGTMIDVGAPTVLIIPGSGPTDRDGNNPMGIKASSYRMLAEALAAREISSVRIDKRGMFGSKAAVANPNDVTIAAYAEDTHHWIDAIRARTGARCVWVLGHSEGGLIALAAARQPEGICGLLLVSAAGRPIGVLLREQIAASGAPEAITKQASDAIDKLEAGQAVDPAGMPPGFAALFNPAVQPYLIDLISYDPARLAASYKGPMLIVQGERDIQVQQADMAALKAARPDATLIEVPGMTHVLKHVDTADRAANVATYADPGLPLAPGLADGIAAFVKSHPTRK